MSEFGVLYLVDQNPHFLRMLDVSLQSLRRFHPDWPVEITRLDSLPVPAWKRLYRRLSVWKLDKRRARGFHDTRIIGRKAQAMVATPFRHTLFLDADTVVMRPLDELRRRAQAADVMVTPLDWKSYAGVEDWQPRSFPYLNSGVVFFSRRFADKYRPYVERLVSRVESLPTMDQYIFSLACHLESESLRILMEPTLQIDVINLDQHLGERRCPRRDGIADLSYEGLRDFHVFHYNEYKDRYLEEIGRKWNLAPGRGLPAEGQP